MSGKAMSENAFEALSSTQWRALGRAARWKILGGALVIAASLTAQLALIWLRVRVGNRALPMIGPMPTQTLDRLWLDLVRAVADDDTHTRLLFALALNAALWGGWLIWFTWRAMQRGGAR